MASVFTKIINRELSAHIIYEDDQCISFLDINPLTEGHCLVIPKEEVDQLFDLKESAYLHLQKVSKSIAIALKKATNAKRIGVAVVGFEVPHAHIHLIPINKMDDMNFSNEKLSLSTTELEEIKARTLSHL